MGTETRILETHTLVLVGPERSWESDVPEAWPSWLQETQENLTDLLPEGFRVEIYEWDEEKNDE